MRGGERLPFFFLGCVMEMTSKRFRQWMRRYSSHRHYHLVCYLAGGMIDVDEPDDRPPIITIPLWDTNIVWDPETGFHRHCRNEVLNLVRMSLEMPDQTHMRDLVRIFGTGPLAHMLAASPIDIASYAAGDIPIPERIAERALFLSALTECLLGAYGEQGVNDWFDRPRIRLGDRTPRELLRGEWRPSDLNQLGIFELAHSLVGPGSAT